MAHWISSKLKAAETLLHQIDQQAPESLGKNEKPRSDEQSGLETSPRTGETRLLIKKQLKKVVPENISEKHDLKSRIQDSLVFVTSSSCVRVCCQKVHTSSNK